MSDPRPRPRPPRVAVLASRVRADEKRIFSAFERRAVDFEHVDTRRLSGRAGGPSPWPVVLNREIGHVRAVYAARMLEAAGSAVVNSAAAIETCGDKWRTTQALVQAGLPVPRSTLALTPEAAAAALEEIGYPAVIKPLTGSWGRLVTSVHDQRAAAAVLEYVAALPSPQSHIVYLQELIAKPDRDIRIVVVGERALGATYRRGADWRTNVARGAASEPCPLTPDLAKLAVQAAAAVGADIAGVDLIEDGAGGVFVLEVNHGVEFSGFQQALAGRVDVAARIADLVTGKAQPC